MALVGLAASRPTPDVQRLGYLLDMLGERDLARPLVTALECRRHRPILLAPGEGTNGEHPDDRWRVIPNAIVETDL